MRFRFVAAERAQFPVSLLCKTIGVTRQGFYAWQRRAPSAAKRPGRGAVGADPPDPHRD